MKDEGVDSLFDGIDKNNTLTSINLKANKITDVGGKMIARKIMSRCALKHLDLSSNNLTDKSGTLMMKALLTNGVMETLNLNNNVFEDETG